MKFPHLFALAYLVLAALGTPAAAESLFDSKTLDGWQGDSQFWQVKDGMIVSGTLGKEPHGEYLSYKKTYRNFKLKWDYKVLSADGLENAGVMFRSRLEEAPTRDMTGYRCTLTPGKAGQLFDAGRREKALAFDLPSNTFLEKAGDWNHGEVRCEGPRISVLLNGKMAVDYSERLGNVAKDGLIGLAIQGSGQARIAFRNLSVEVLSEDLVPPEDEILHRFGEGRKGPLPSPFVDGKFLMADHEIVVFTGQTNLVREQQAGELEAELASAFAVKKPSFRSMAWEGDTVYDQWRDINFGSWTGQLEAAGATMIIAQFGQVEALDGVKRIPEFTAAYHQLLNQFAARTPRTVILSPMPFEKPLADHAPDLTLRNGEVKAYAEAIQKIAVHRGAVYIDLFQLLSQRDAAAERLTDNGMHLNKTGLHVVAEMIARQLGAEPKPQATLQALRGAVMEKNLLWFDCWRPANWSFVYGDRISQLFGKPGGDAPSLRESFEVHRPLIEKWDERIREMALHPEAPLPPEPALAKTSSTPPATDNPDDSPEAERASFTVAEGYEINLFASERDGLVKPTQITWDEKGRLYAACSPTYPHLLAGAKPGDYILVMEDSHGQGYADKTWRYAEGLRMVQGLEPGNGGLYVCDFDKLVHYNDHGDAHGKERTVLMSGFGVGDTHQLVNSITHGPDGTLWFTQGLHIFSRVETPWGLSVLEKAGVWRFHPRTLRMDAFFSGGKAGHNCWGVAFDDYNQVFHKSGDRPQGYYTVPGMIRLDNPDDYHPTGAIFDTNPKTTSLEFIGTKALPDDIQGCVCIGGYFGNVVELHRVIDDGAGFRSEQLPKLVRSTSKSFRPVDISVGPDGAIYLADWYNPIIGHYQASYADPHRDKIHGRIWRISAKGRAPAKQPDLASMKPAELLEQLRSPERWTRSQAKRLMFDMPTAEVLKATDAWLDGLKATGDEYDKLLMEAIGIYTAHEEARPKLLDKLLAAKDPRVRSYATRVIGDWADKLPDPLALLKTRIHDDNARVRMEAIVACSYVSKPESVEVAAQALDSPRDRFIDYALAQCVRSLQPRWRTLFAEKKLTFGGNAAQMDYIRKSTVAPAPEHPGKVIYQSLCLNCHQPDGKGLPGIYPPLLGSEWVRGESTTLVKFLLHGLIGPITVKDQQYGKLTPLPMPPSGLTDQQIADVLTYVRLTYGSKAPAVNPDSVAKIRDQTKDHTALWTLEELKKETK